jgi:spermidine/putrescine transport system permease protein
MRRWSGLRLYAILYLVFLYAPIVLLPIFAFNDAEIIAFPLAGFSTRWFEQLWTTQALHHALGNSLFIAAVTAVIATSLGICAAQSGAGARFPGKRGVLGFIMLPLVLPEIVIAVALLVVIRQVFDLDLSNWTVIAAHVVICTPFSIAILNGAFQNLDPSFTEAAMDLGETRWGAFRLVTLPLVTPGIVSSLLICFIISLDDFVIAQFLTGSNPTLPVYMYGLTRQVDALPLVMALGTILVLISITLLVIAEWFRRRGVARSGLKDAGGLL